MKQLVSIDKMVELEKLIPNLNVSIEELYKNGGYTYSEIMYLAKAILLPLNEFQEIINYYDSSKGIDELRYFNNIAKQYKTDEKIIISRVQEVRAIKYYNEIKTYGEPKTKRLHIGNWMWK